MPSGPGPEVTESLAHEMVKSLHDLRNEIAGLRDDAKEYSKRSSVKAITDRLDDLMSQQEVLIDEVSDLTEAIHMLVANFNILGAGANMIRGILQRRGPSGPPAPPMPPY